MASFEHELERYRIKRWYCNGKRHRLDGPAVVWPNGVVAWFIDGKEFTQKQFEQHPLVVFYRLTKNIE
jgi:hypothetical protein